MATVDGPGVRSRVAPRPGSTSFWSRCAKAFDAGGGGPARRRYGVSKSTFPGAIHGSQQVSRWRFEEPRRRGHERDDRSGSERLQGGAFLILGHRVHTASVDAGCCCPSPFTGSQIASP